ncbi:MAG: 2Fe-2S iron-sulfur cluster-binding protein [Polyangia bacterium]|jgi:NADH-quinone oxidoreductase subunit G|nr:2Fe-2S iron-sulfur cluster-binding protein [Polyangia bacterium]
MSADPTIKLTIDGREAQVAQGTNLIEAARSIGVEIPHFCYHPGLKVVAVCRQCLVEVRGWPKLVPGCQTLAQEGMEVLTSSERARDAQRQQLEFTLLNHPVDCPICDQVGECDLQRLYFDYDCMPTRHDLARLPGIKAHPIGPRITYDAERCILCWRCIRVCDEVAREHQLDLKERGMETVIATAPGAHLDNPYSLCTVDLCPVGALTETAFRFDTRVFKLTAVDSICPGCATGCHIELHSYGGVIRRTTPRYSAEVNRWWMCDDGRGEPRELQGSDRAGRGKVEGRPVSLEEACVAASELLSKHKADELILLVSAQLSTETLWAARALSEALGGVQVFGTARPDWQADGVLKSADRNPNSKGLELVFGGALAGAADLEQRLSSGTAKVAICLDEKTTNPALAESVEQVIALVHRDAGIAEWAKVSLPMAAWCEMDGSFVNKDGRVGRFHPAAPAPGEALPGWALLAKLAIGAGRPLDIGTRAEDIYAAASRALGEAVLPPGDFGPSRPPLLLRFANGRG